ncbi:MAG TPA: hypothetical protein VFZ25_13175 [Chloroflexota bacterium]|nr:hypothetical protein [Chloroflexota bacterium]
MPIQPIEREGAPEEVRALYEQIEQSGVKVSRFYRLLGHRPAALRAILALSAAVMGPGTVSSRLKNLAFIRASALNGCDL